MQISVNLSRRPFSNRRFLWIGLGIVFLSSLWIFLWIAAETARVSARADQVDLQIKLNKDQVEKIRQEEEKKKREAQLAVMSEQDAFQLAAARRLLERKSFSWNRLISDIEDYVPKEARIMSIKVNEVLDTNESVAASVEIKAIGKTAAQMTEMMSKLNESRGLFSLGQSSQEQITEVNEVPFTINVTYRPF
ncbi:MAG TPA: hypothetical protein VLD57_00855 [Blastocatellia bacterium]|nr:hypothetical protein [Blastocatellia bacterium]